MVRITVDNHPAILGAVTAIVFVEVVVGVLVSAALNRPVIPVVPVVEVV